MRRLADSERRLLELAADRSIDGPLKNWPALRNLFRRLGAPHGAGLHGVLVRQIAAELLVELGLRPRPDGPLVAISARVFLRAWPRASRWEEA